jgi:nucleoside-diphosphate-sugar epimerase
LADISRPDDYHLAVEDGSELKREIGQFDMAEPRQARVAPRLRRAIVTGSTGFIGSHVAKRLQAEGVTVIGLSRSTGFDVLTDVLPLDDVDHVYHLAGITFVPRSWDDPIAFHHINTHGTVRVLDQCRRSGVPVTFASAYAYGTPARLPIDEHAPTNAGNPYTYSKLSAENACRFFCDAYGARVAIVRPFNVYGPGQDHSFLIPTIVRQVLDPSVREIVVASLAPRRDFVYISDAVEAILLAPCLPHAEPLNVGGGRSYSVEDIVRISLECAGVVKPYRDRGEVRSNEIPDTVADISAIERVCAWRPRVDIASGIHALIASLTP